MINQTPTPSPLPPSCDGHCGQPADGHTHLSMPDPCPHISRLDLIAARLNGDPIYTEMLAHIDICDDELCAMIAADDMAYADTQFGL